MNELFCWILFLVRVAYSFNGSMILFFSILPLSTKKGI